MSPGGSAAGTRRRLCYTFANGSKTGGRSTHDEA